MSKKRPYKIKNCTDGPTFDAICRLCGATSVGWDFARNARRAVRSHVQTEHSWYEIQWPPVVLLDAKWRYHDGEVREEDL